MTYHEETLSCDGTDSIIVGADKCYIPLLSLQVPPFDLTLGDSVYATVTASNNYGESLQSAPGNGATIVLVPDAPVVEDETLVTSGSVIGLKWTDGESSGGSAVIDYRV
jgi:hypothetical protein